ncbi:HK97 gp10 family phage protein [Amycolatopsis sp. NPDC021455]|uniref:HK97 gp10 family phage protein n=1 Tax=Amycolatopsis sp. NPDC021455 TaxID=3154901 RepID=UPI00340AA24F
MGKYVPNRAGFTRLATGRKVRQHMLEIGEYWATELRASAPHDTGAYASNITVHAITAEVKGLPRAGVQITARVSYASALEHGNTHIKNPPRPMTKLLDRIRAADPKHQVR